MIKRRECCPICGKLSESFQDSHPCPGCDSQLRKHMTMGILFLIVDMDNELFSKWKSETQNRPPWPYFMFYAVIPRSIVKLWNEMTPHENLQCALDHGYVWVSEKAWMESGMVPIALAIQKRKDD